MLPKPLLEQEYPQMSNNDSNSDADQLARLMAKYQSRPVVKKYILKLFNSFESSYYVLKDVDSALAENFRSSHSNVARSDSFEKFIRDNPMFEKMQDKSDDPIGKSTPFNSYQYRYVTEDLTQDEVIRAVTDFVINISVLGHEHLKDFDADAYTISIEEVNPTQNIVKHHEDFKITCETDWDLWRYEHWIQGEDNKLEDKLNSSNVTSKNDKKRNYREYRDKDGYCIFR